MHYNISAANSKNLNDLCKKMQKNHLPNVRKKLSFKKKLKECRILETNKLQDLSDILTPNFVYKQADKQIRI